MIMGKQVRGLGCSVSVRSCESCRRWGGGGDAASVALEGGVAYECRTTETRYKYEACTPNSSVDLPDGLDGGAENLQSVFQ